MFLSEEAWGISHHNLHESSKDIYTKKSITIKCSVDPPTSMELKFSFDQVVKDVYILIYIPKKKRRERHEKNIIIKKKDVYSTHPMMDWS